MRVLSYEAPIIDHAFCVGSYEIYLGKPQCSAPFT